MIEQLTQIMKNAYNWFTKPSLLFSISFTCVIAVSLPTKFQELFGYHELITPIKGYFGLIGILCFVFGTMSVFVHYIIPFLRWLISRCERKAILKNLSRDEKQYLSTYLKENCSCLSFPPSDGVINMLLLKKIVFTPSNLGSCAKMDYCLQPWVGKILTKNQEMKTEIIKNYMEIL